MDFSEIRRLEVDSDRFPTAEDFFWKFFFDNICVEFEFWNKRHFLWVFSEFCLQIDFIVCRATNQVNHVLNLAELTNNYVRNRENQTNSDFVRHFCDFETLFLQILSVFQ